MSDEIEKYRNIIEASDKELEKNREAEKRRLDAERRALAESNTKAWEEDQIRKENFKKWGKGKALEILDEANEKILGGEGKVRGWGYKSVFYRERHDLGDSPNSAETHIKEHFEHYKAFELRTPRGLSVLVSVDDENSPSKVLLGTGRVERMFPILGIQPDALPAERTINLLQDFDEITSKFRKHVAELIVNIYNQTERS